MAVPQIPIRWMCFVVPITWFFSVELCVLCG
jgi:hypothetical protein